MKLRVRGGWVIGWVDGNGCACRARVAGGIKHLPVRRSRIFPTSVSFFPAGFASSASSCGCSACATAAIPRKANIILTTAIVKCVCICGQRQVSNSSRNYSSRSITADAQTRREAASAPPRRTTGGAVGGGGGWRHRQCTRRTRGHVSPKDDKAAVGCGRCVQDAGRGAWDRNKRHGKEGKGGRPAKKKSGGFPN